MEAVAKQPGHTQATVASPQVNQPEASLLPHVHRTPIASPSIPQPPSNIDPNTVAPHLHLTCDLLPCPHGTDHTPSLYFESKHLSKHHHSCHDNQHPCCHRNRDKHHHADDHSSKKSDKHRSRTHLPRASELRKSTSSDTDSDFEHYKKKHLMSMQREIEESLASTESESARHRSRQEKARSSKSLRSKSREKYELYSSEEVPERDSNKTSEKRSSSEPAKSSQRDKNMPSDGLHRGKQKDKSSEKSLSSNRKSSRERNVKDSDSRKTSRLDSEQSSVGEEGGVPGKFDPSNKKQPTRRENSQQFPEPKFQSSPKSFKLSSTIGQVGINS